MNLADSLSSLLSAENRLTFGELVLCLDAGGSYSARHRNDEGRAVSDLADLDSVRALREMAKHDEAGEYRPLKTAPGLKSGWHTATDSPREFLQRLDAIYPGLFATWVAYDSGTFPPVPLRDTLGRQTGMYRFAGGITDGMAHRILAELCTPGCLRCITWPIDGTAPLPRVARGAGTLPLLCTEACTFAVSRARELAKEAYDLANPPAPAQG